MTVFSDGEPALPNLIRGAIGGPDEHILDWLHISMRIRHVELAMKGLVQTKGFCGISGLCQRPAERLRWWVWHGRTRIAAPDLHWLIAQACAVTNLCFAARQKQHKLDVATSIPTFQTTSMP